MENDSAHLYSTDAYSPSKGVTRHIDNAHADGMILAGQSPPPAQPMHYVPMLLGPENTITVCQYCRASIRTSVRYTTTTRTHMTAAVFGLSICCCIPYFITSTKNCDHYCPNCAKYLGTYER